MDETFLTALEIRIGTALKEHTDAVINSFWCDGLLLSEPDMYYSLKYINDNRQTQLMVYTGRTGQDEYLLTLHFGPKSLSRLARQLDLSYCLPGISSSHWFQIDSEKRIIAIQLD